MATKRMVEPPTSTESDSIAKLRVSTGTALLNSRARPTRCMNATSCLTTSSIWRLPAAWNTVRRQETRGDFTHRCARIARGPRNGGNTMKATELLHNLGQSLWLDNITRDLLNSGTLKRYLDELSVTGL